jgi:asparagine synthase (glutamine-hydrolysing)
MCGIAGVVLRDGSCPEKTLLARMNDTLIHRGPDGGAVEALAGCGLAHRRLAVVDLSAEAAQPMSAADGRVWVVFNGEIYNFRELRGELEALGHRFRTAGDTEVILEAYLEWGEGCVHRLDGMFALALWDVRARTLLLARDRTGKKPLYVYEDSKRLVFASELKAIFAHGGLDESLRREAVPEFLAYGYVPTPGTFFRRIRKVSPATFEVHPETGAPRTVEYWDFPVRPDPLQVPDKAEWTKKLRALFFSAVEKRMVADVPLGAFLSGGIDSTLVVAAMAQLSSKPVRTFSIGFEGHPSWDETPFARMVAARYRTDHTEFSVKPESFELLEKLAWHYDEPFGDSSAIPSYIVAKLTREQVTVALTGDGGDELFAGYPRFIGAVAAERIPQIARTAARWLMAPLPHGQEHQGLWERGRRFALQASRELPERLRNWVSVFTAEELAGLLHHDLLELASAGTLGASYTQWHRRAGAASALNRVLYINAHTYLLDDLNVKVDRASMAVGLETRAPFLDTALMEYVFALPAQFKLRGMTTKRMLKKAMSDLLPPEIVTRKKMGFGVPLGAWFRGPLKGLLEDGLIRPGLALHDFVRRDALGRLVEAHRTGRRDYGLQLWSLWMLQSFLSRRSVEKRAA